MVEPLYDELMKDVEFQKYYHREVIMSEITTVIYESMKKQGLTQKSLAKIAGVSKGRISQILSGNYNITVKTISDLLFALKADLNISIKPKTWHEVYGIDRQVWTMPKLIVHQPMEQERKVA